MSATSSETIGPLNPQAVVSKLTGQQHGETGAVALSRPDAARRLAAQSVATTNLNLEASLRSRCNVSKRHKSVVLTGELDMEVVPAGPGTMDLASASSMVELALQDWTSHPDGDQLITAALAYCDAMTRRKSDDAAAMTIQAYKTALARYPLDVALQALREWPENHSFFPTWFELRERCDKLASPRLILRHLIQRAAA